MFWRNYFYRVSLIKQTLLGSIDAVVLEKEVYHKDDNESEEESPDATSKEKATGKVLSIFFFVGLIYMIKDVY